MQDSCIFLHFMQKNRKKIRIFERKRLDLFEKMSIMNNYREVNKYA